MKHYSATTKGFDVYRNGTYLGFVSGQSLKLAKQTIKDLVLSTHMGQWIKLSNGYEYATTIGVYIKFEKCKRLTEVLSNYSLKMR